MNPLPPFVPHIVLHDVFAPGQAAALLAFALAHEAHFKPSRVGYEDTRRIDAVQRTSLTLQDVNPFAPAIAGRFRDLAPDIIAALGISDFVPHHAELEMAVHGDGAFFGRHIDFLGDAAAATQRVLSGVYYLHAEPKAFDGGALRLYELLPSHDAEPRSLDIVPANNTAVFFPSSMLHEVLPVRVPSGRFADSRFSINCWYHVALNAQP